MKCARCGKDTYTLETRDGKEPYVRRRKKCSSCGFQFTTYEFTDEVVKAAESLMGGRKRAVTEIRKKVTRTAETKEGVLQYRDLKKGDPVFIPSEVRPYRVRCRDRRYIICTKPYNFKHTVMYFIIDLDLGIRGPDDRVFCFGYETQEQCEERLKELQRGEIEVSRRRCVTI